MDTELEVPYDDIRDDTWFLQAEQQAWQEHVLDQINLELAEICSEQRVNEIA